MGDLPNHTPHKSYLGVWDAVSVIIGIVIGVGIHETAPMIFRVVESPWAAVACWFAGGVLSLVGALCFAELATSIPHAGGDYHFLKHSFGTWAGFLFGWLHLAVLKPASIGMMVFIFANYASKLAGIEGSAPVIIPVAAAVALSVINIAGVALGKRIQNTLTILKVLGFSGIIVSGLVFGKASMEAVVGTGADASPVHYGLAMVFVLYAYGGWNDAALVTSEIKDPQKNLPRALLIGVFIITVVYVLINLAYLRGVGFEAARNSHAIAADVLQLSLGEFGHKAMCVLVMVSALGAANGIIFAGSRIYTALGNDFKVFEAVGRWNPKTGTPVTALAVEGIITVGLILLVGSGAGRHLIDLGLGAVGFGGLEWEGHGGFDTLFRCTAPFFWTLFLMTGLAVFILRIRKPDMDRPFKVPYYPITPAIFSATSAYMLYSATEYAGRLILLGALLMLLGAIFYLLQKRNPSSSSQI